MWLSWFTGWHRTLDRHWKEGQAVSGAHMCHLLQDVLDEQHCIFIFELTVTSATSMQIFSSKLVQYKACIAKCEPNACGCFVRECFSCKKCTSVLCLTESQKQNSVCLARVRPYDIEQHIINTRGPLQGPLGLWQEAPGLVQHGADSQLHTVFLLARVLKY